MTSATFPRACDLEVTTATAGGGGSRSGCLAGLAVAGATSERPGTLKCVARRSFGWLGALWVGCVALLVLAGRWLIVEGQERAAALPRAAAEIALFAAATLLGGLLARAQSATAGAGAQLGPYRLTEKIGEGGMGVVYKARHSLSPRPIALKVLPAARGSEANRRRFEREARATSQLSHPNTIAVHDFGSTDDGTLYYAMEYVDGVDLQSLVEAEGPQPAARVAHLLAQLCGALAEAHALGLVHRDVKPANVVVAQATDAVDVVKVLDFGLVQDLGEVTEPARSEVRELIGTPLYLSPEAIANPDRVDARSDLYAVGALGYFLLTGEPPFSGRGVLEVCAHHLHTLPEAPSKRAGLPVPGALEALILSCLEKAPEARPPDASSLRAALLPLASPWLEARDWTVTPHAS